MYEAAHQPSTAQDLSGERASIRVKLTRMEFSAGPLKVTGMFLARLAAFALGLVFAWAAVSKAVNLQAWRAALARYRLPSVLQSAALLGAPAGELGLAALFFFGRTRVAAALTLAALVAFSLTIVRARAIQGSRLPCGCFGSHKERDYRLLLARNTVLATGAGALLVYGRDVAGYPSAPSGEAWLPAALIVIGAGLVVWLIASARSGMRRDVV